MRVVANSSVLIALSAIGRLPILLQRFPEGILIPDAVWHEVVEAGRGRPGAREVREASWIQRCTVRDQDFVRFLCTELDVGEAEAIALARQEQADLVLLDEKEARRLARRLGLQVLGTVGLLIWAKQRGLLSSLRVELQALQERGGFRLASEVCRMALRQVGEAE